MMQGTGIRYSRGLLVCAGVALYGLWLIYLSWHGDTAKWLRPFGPFCNVRKVQAVLGLLFQLPLAGYLYLGYSTGIIPQG